MRRPIDLHAVRLGRPLGWPAARDNLVLLDRWFALRFGSTDRRRCCRAYCQARADLPTEVDFTAIYSRRDGIVDWRACIDPVAVAVEVRSSHVGMAFDPAVIAAVSAALRPAVGSVVEVDRGETA